MITSEDFSREAAGLIKAETRQFLNNLEDKMYYLGDEYSIKECQLRKALSLTVHELIHDFEKETDKMQKRQRVHRKVVGFRPE